MINKLPKLMNTDFAKSNQSGNGLISAIEEQMTAGVTPDEHMQLGELRRLVADASRCAQTMMAEIEGWQSNAAFSPYRIRLLFDEACNMLAMDTTSGIGGGYKFLRLLAAEARFCTFVGIAQGKLPQESWFALGRLLTIAGGKPVLVSWSGSMFEYLMPLLVMPTYEDSLLDQTYKAAVARQIEYGKKHAVPWGISESGYNAIDGHLTYQYRAFGGPALVSSAD